MRGWIPLWALLIVGCSSVAVVQPSTTTIAVESPSHPDPTTPGPISGPASDTSVSTPQGETTAVALSEPSSTTVFVDTNGTDPNPDQSQPFSAWWALDPTFTPNAEAMSLPIIVTEMQCASAIDPTGRIHTSVEYLPAEVRVTVIVNSVGGYANCPGNPATPFVVELTEPLGNRTIVGESPPPY